MSQDTIFKEIIKGYRNLISERYNYKNLNKKYDLPATINQEIVEEIKNFFLNYIYPDISKREELNEAFKSLDNNLKNPEKLFGVFKESIKLVFKHGRHLPKIINAGFKALKSFRAATKFENTLVKAAKEKKEKPPFDAALINELIASLSRRDIDRFIDSTESLFEIMYDKVLVQKIIDVLSYLILRMRKQEDVFASEDIKGLEIGLQMITKGNEVLNSLSTEDQGILIQFIVAIEKDNLDTLFST